MKKALIAYHDNCIDGFTSAWVTYNALKETYNSVELIPVQYKPQSLEELENLVANSAYNILMVVDFSLPVEMLQSLQLRAPMTFVTILDHHKTAFEAYGWKGELEKDSKMDTILHGAAIYLRNDMSGAGICQYVSHPRQQIPALVAFVQDYDLWQFKLGEPTKWVNKYLGEREKSIRSWNEVAAALDDPKSRIEILEAGKKLQVEHDAEVAKIVAHAKPGLILGHKVWVGVCHPKFSSDVGHVLAEKSGTFGATYWPTESGDEELWSLRSVGDFDVSAVAKRLGGGGHAAAAGFRLCAYGYTDANKEIVV